VGVRRRPGRLATRVVRPGGLEQRVAYGLRNLEGHEPVRRVEVVLAALVHDADVYFALGVGVSEQDVELALERRLVALVANADGEPGLRFLLLCHG
jgi:hypothetical protein